jgi:peptidoglycan/LPS O-acetylase OafA/YrhL
MQTIGSSFNFKNNSFSFLRFLFAFSILYFHTFLLGGFGQEPLMKYPFFDQGIGRIGVYGFFVISGFLVTRSFVTSPGIINYGVKRFLRVYPGFWVNLLVTSFLFAPLIYLYEKETLKGFLSSGSENPLKYILTNFSTLMRQYNIAGLLSENPFPHVFNGSLWTLFLEVKAYLLLAVIGMFGLLGKKRFLVLGTFTILWFLILFGVTIESSPNKFLRLLVDAPFLEYGTYFFAGSSLFLFKDFISLNNKIIFICIMLLVIVAFLGYTHKFLPLFFPLIVIWLANNLPFRNFDKYGDFSYGIYLYAFPIQQIVTRIGLNHDPISYLIICFSFTFIAAAFSWHLVEKPFLRLKKLAVFKLPVKQKTR